MPRPPRPAPAPGALGRDLPPPPGSPSSRAVPTSRSTPVTPTGSTSACSTPATTTARSERRVPLARAGPRLVVRLRPGHGPGAAVQRAGGRRVAAPTPGSGTTPPSCCSTPYARAVEGEVTLGPGGLRPRRRRRLARRRRAALRPRQPGLRAALRRRRRRVRLGGRPPAEPVPQRDGASTRRTCATRPRCTPTCPRSCAAPMPGWPTPRRWPTSPSSASPPSSCCRCTPSPTSRTWCARGMTNHWGYNTLGFFAPHPAYAAATDPQGVVDEVKGMVKLLHREGIEVILDVVYNHTAEQDRTGATLSWRGLDQRAYYRLDERGRDIDVTGCGNTLDLRHPVVCRMVLDSLRYWVQEFHVDGFRFDLAVALGRGRGDEFDPDHPFLVALRTDPVLSAGHAHRRAVGPRDARLAHRPVPPAVHGVERPLPRRRAAVLDQRRARPGPRPALARPAGPRHPARRVARPVRAPRPGAHGLGQLRRRPRRLHRWPTSRPTTTSTTRPTARTTATAATATPRGTTASRARPTTPGVRRRPRPHHPQPARHAAAVDRRADAQRRRRDGPHPGRQQQRLLPGQRDELARLGPRALAGRPPRDDAAPGPGAPGAAGAAPAGLGPRAPGARRRQPRHGVVRRRRHAPWADRWDRPGHPGACRCTSPGPGWAPSRRSSSSTAAPTSTR